MKQLAGLCALIFIGLSGGSACAIQENQAIAIGSLPASGFPFVETAFRDFFGSRNDFGCFEIFVSRGEQFVHVMLLPVDRQTEASEHISGLNAGRADQCGPGARYDFEMDGELINRTYIRPYQ